MTVTHISFSDQLLSVLKQVDSLGVELRRSEIFRQRVAFIVSGPKHIWSTDWHMKLQQYGIEIYGAIDVD